MKNIILEKIKTFKEKPFYSTLLNINYNEEESRLVLITRDCINNDKMIDLLSKWRHENEFWFQATFPVTHDGTKNWLANKLIEEPDRLLFIIEVNTELIGHVGLWRFDFAQFSCEIDNIVRGEKKYPGIMFCAIESLHKWARSILNIHDFYLQTYLENFKAVNLYKRLGYEIIKIDPVIKISNGPRTEWILSPDNYSGTIERHQIKMALKRE